MNALQRNVAGEWDVLYNSTKTNVVQAFFNEKIWDSQECEVFSIDGVPAACMVYSSYNAHNAPVVDAFFFNKGLFLLYDAGPCMRRRLFRKHSLISIQRAINRATFLWI